MKERITYFDFLRGIAIMMVVGIHTYTLGKDSLEMRQVLNAAVPLFIAISGYFLSQKEIKDKQDYTTFLKKQLPKVYIPVLVWSLPLYIPTILAGNDIALKTVYWLACGFSIYYFVAFIMQCYITLPLIKRLTSSNLIFGGVICTFISFLWIAGTIWINTVQGRNLPLLLYAGPLPCWLMFFALGVIIGNKPDRRYSLIIPIFITLTGLALSVIESNYLLNNYAAGAGIKPSAFLYSTGVVLLLFSQHAESWCHRTGRLYRFIVWIGSLSFGIYLIHCYLIKLLIKILSTDNWPVKFAAVLLSTVVFIVCLKKAIPSKLHRYFGL